MGYGNGPMDDETTSHRRRSMCEAIVHQAMDKSRPDHADVVKWLDAELTAMPFQRRGDQALEAMARKVVPKALVDHIVATKSAERFDTTASYLCPDCHDERLIEVSPDRWDRCNRCNPLPVENPT